MTTETQPYAVESAAPKSLSPAHARTLRQAVSFVARQVETCEDWRRAAAETLIADIGTNLDETTYLAEVDRIVGPNAGDEGRAAICAFFRTVAATSMPKRAEAIILAAENAARAKAEAEAEAKRAAEERAELAKTSEFERERQAAEAIENRKWEAFEREHIPAYAAWKARQASTSPV